MMDEIVKFSKEIYTIDCGYYAQMGGPIATLKDGLILWLTQCPETMRENFTTTWGEIRESRDNGISWSRPRIVVKGNETEAPFFWALLPLASGRLMLLGTFHNGENMEHPEKSYNYGFTMVSKDNGLTWSQPEKIPNAERYLGPGMACLIQLSGGRLVFPFSYLYSSLPQEAKGGGRALISGLYSDDEGETWQRSASTIDIGGSGYESGAEEPSLVELPDGRLWMLIRSQSGFLWESFSNDQGVTWEPARPTRFVSSNAPASFLKVSDGRIIIVWGNTVAGKIPSYARQSLAAAVTRDGKNFYGFREIAHTEYPTPEDTYWTATYPYLTEAPDGTILVSFNHGNWDVNQAKLARIDPAWLEESSLREDFRQGRKEWCSLGIGPSGSGLKPANDKKPGAELEVGRWRKDYSGIVRNFPLLDKGTFSLTATLVAPEAYLLWHNSFLLPGQSEEACLRVRFAPEGRVFIGAGNPEIRQTDRGHAHKLDFSCTAYPVREEVVYPGKISPDKRFRLTLRYDLAGKKAVFSLDGGPEMSLPFTADVMGICYFGIATKDGGIIRVREFQSGNK